MAEALTADGGKLSGKDKTGLGYTGEKIERNPSKRFASTGEHSQNHIHITTVYDDPNETDPAEAANRRSDLTRNKNRTRRIKNVFAKP